MQSDHNKQLITLTVITLSGFHYSNNMLVRKGSLKSNNKGFFMYFMYEIYFNLTSQYYKRIKSFLSLLSERRAMRASKNAILGLGVGSNPGPLAQELCALQCAPLHIHQRTNSDQCMLDWYMSSMTFVPPWQLSDCKTCPTYTKMWRLSNCKKCTTERHQLLWSHRACSNLITITK